MLPGPGRRPGITGVTLSVGTLRIAGTAGAVGTLRARLRSGFSGRMRSVCTTFTGMSMSGSRIAGTLVTLVLRAMEAHGRAAIVSTMFSAAGPGSAIHGTSARRTGTGASPGSATAMSVFAWLERSPLESLPPYLWEVPGACPRSVFFCGARTQWRNMRRRRHGAAPSSPAFPRGRRFGGGRPHR